MSYEKALQAAGAVLHDFGSFGSYQGDWIAKVTYNGVSGYVRGSFGSCSGCDAFEAEFGYNDDACSDHRYTDPEPGCAACEVAKVTYDAKLKAFGESYLDNFHTTEDVVYAFIDTLEWDYEARDILDWVADHQ